jgi:glycosyltransferase involved in cell wall biosynthesis
MKLALIIPCFNERDNIPYIVKRIKDTFSYRNDIEVILVDNGSTDGSNAVLVSQLENIDFIRYVEIKENIGYGGGILFGLDAVSDADVYAWTHADMQCDPKDVLTAFDLFCAKENDLYLIKGKRMNRAFLDQMFTFTMQSIANIVLNIKVNDINAQPKVFARSFYENHIQGIAPIDFSLDLFLLYQAKRSNLGILDVPVRFGNRINGVAKGGGSWSTRAKLIKRTLTYIFKLKQSTNLKGIK